MLGVAAPESIRDESLPSPSCVTRQLRLLVSDAEA